MAKATAKISRAKKAAPKKAAVKKATTPVDKSSSIKYSDKSAGQPGLVPIFNELVKIMEPFARGSVEKVGGKDGQVGLISKKTIEMNGRNVSEVYLAGSLVQKGYVGFYFMPVYTAPEIKSTLQPELLKCLKGKSCFHIKKMDEQVFRQIKDALKKGYDLYKRNGWIS